MATDKDNTYNKVSMEPFNHMKVEDWLGVLLLACEKYRNCKLNCVNPSFVGSPCRLPGLKWGECHHIKFMGIQTVYPCCSLKKGVADELLKTYMITYERGCLPIESYKSFKTFSKSIEETLKYLETQQKIKGEKFYIDKFSHDSIVKDVRFFTDLAYLHHKGYIELTVPKEVVVYKDGFIEDIGIILKFSVADIRSALLPKEPDAEYCGLRLFCDEQHLQYKSATIVVRTASKYVKILLKMMTEKKPVSIKDMVKEVGIKNRVRDKSGRNALESMISDNINSRLGKLEFPWVLGVTDSKIVWKHKL